MSGSKGGCGRDCKNATFTPTYKWKWFQVDTCEKCQNKIMKDDED